MRADVYLTVNGFCESRNRAAVSINGGCLFVNGKNVTKCSFDINEGDEVELRGEVIPFVSRGGLKLKGAFDAFGVSSDGLVCVDIGASTGGFTDVLLKHGAKKVYAVDCGRGQLHGTLASDARVVNIEGFNARELTVDTLGEKCDMAVMDVSFISQTLLHGAVRNVLKDGGLYVTLIKPQFEVGREYIAKGGIVKSAEAQTAAIEKVVKSAQDNGFCLMGIDVSVITGGDGNREFTAVFKLSEGSGTALTRELLKKLTAKK